MCPDTLGQFIDGIESSAQTGYEDQPKRLDALERLFVQAGRQRIPPKGPVVLSRAAESIGRIVDQCAVTGNTASWNLRIASICASAPCKPAPIVFTAR
jgi:hypothetical protein